MQHGETGAALPRHLAKQRGRAVCDAHNARNPRHKKANPTTGLFNDRTGMFVTVVKKKKSVRTELVKP